MTQSPTAQRWAERLQRFSQSGMTVAQFCQAEGVSQPAYYHWRRKLLGPAANHSDSVSHHRPTPTLVPVRITHRDDPTTIHDVAPPKPLARTRIQLPGGVCVEVEVLGGESLTQSDESVAS